MQFFGSVILFIGLSTTLSSSAWAQSAQELVQRDIAKVMRKYSRETRLFHYFGMATTTSNSGAKTIDRWFLNEDNRKKWLNDLFAARAGAYWDLDNHNTFKVNSGPGMYFALDPNSSKEYGDTMVTLDVPQGTPYLSVVSNVPLKPDTIAALQREGLIDDEQLRMKENTLGLSQGVTMETFKNMVLPENQNFRIMMQNVLENLNIQFIEYGYKSHQNGFCKGGRLTAMVFTGARPVSNRGQVMAVVHPEFQKQNISADYLVGFFADAQNTFVDLMTRYRDTIALIRATAFDAPKVVNWPKALAIISQHLTPEETAQLRSLSFECKTPQ